LPCYMSFSESGSNLMIQLKEPLVSNSVEELLSYLDHLVDTATDEEVRSLAISAINDIKETLLNVVEQVEGLTSQTQGFATDTKNTASQTH